MPSLAVFDLDGTLFDTRLIDTDRCFIPVFAPVFGDAILSEDWSTYPEATSAGVTDELYRRHRGRAPTPVEVEDLQIRLEAAMRASFLGKDDRVPLVPGAEAFLAALRMNPDWRIAVATGNWIREAQVKLESAGLDLTGVPMATSDDRIARREILPLAVARASTAYEVPAWDRVVYVGDRPWDVAAAAANGIAFLGIGSDDRGASLRAAGATRIIADFTDAPTVMRMLDEATVP